MTRSLPVSYTHLDVYKRQAFGPDRLELGEGARIFSGRLHYVDLLQGRVFATDARPGAAIEVLADLAWPVGAVAPDRDGHRITACLLYTSRCV